MSFRLVASFCSGLLALGVPSFALAQSVAPPTEPAETIKPQTATKGATDIATGGYVVSAKPKEDDPTHASDFTLSGGGLFSAGNSRTFAVTSGAKLRFRREEHQLSVAGAVNFARGGSHGEPMETTVENYQGLARYDFFFSDDVSLFAQTTARRDRFQELDLRLNVDPGVAYYFINSKTHRLQGEIGYDFQYDIRASSALQQPPPEGSPPGTPPPPPISKTQALHNSRLFLGYENKLRKEVALVSSVEYLQNFADLDKYRIIFDIGLKSNVSDSLAVATTYTLRYENQPLPGVEQSDSIASVNLVYTLF
ncbi:Peptide chain release factor RF-3 [Labilithrix luteola]|uniref:Peptide chain release factor RF-3 n=1 Tax=Labilithrix luteola TaxID=1391654 RepID=A0A0K1PPC7_9BACT|nr:DUF481 domain-containing protein [Labilithrix luteola]AKU95236.1 Peptide chain release factor RF-3 [Labilithrix luteola]